MFLVYPDKLDAFAERLSRVLARDARTAHDYVQQHLTLTPSDAGVFQNAVGSVNDARDAILLSLTRLDELPTASVRELRACAKMYRETDDAEERRLDALYPGARPETAPRQRESTSMPDSRGDAPSPAAELVEPQAEQPIPSLVDQVLSFPDLISPTHWMMWAIDMVCGVNPAEETAKVVAGDWEELAKAGSAVRNLGEFDSTFAAALDGGAAQMFQGWQGNAASAAAQYFDKLSSAVSEQVPALTALGKEFDTLAYGMWAATQTLVSLLESLVDWLMAAALSAAAGLASSETIVGGILGGAATVFSLTKAMGVWGKVVEVHGYCWDLGRGFTGVVAGYLGALRGLEKHPLPAGAYDHPGV